MVSRKLTAVLGLAMLVLLVAAACSRDGETIPPTRTPTRVATVTMGVTPILDPTSTPLPVVISRPTPVSDPVDGYLTVAPSILRSNATESISVALFSNGRPASGQVELTLLSRGVPVGRVAGFINGQGSLDIEVPSLADGAYELEISGPGFTDRATLMVEARTVLFLETDKPIYKPGQTVHIRVLTLDPDLMPVVGTVEVEVQDAKGIKIFKKVVTSDEYGMATLDLPLSTEPNLGTWKIKALSGKREAQTDIRVEEYVLPKYDVNVDLPRSWILAGEPVRGSVSSEYSFGRPVKGELTIVATRYVGTWEEYARVVEQIPSMENIYVTIDIDSLDPSIAPGTSSPAVDGLLYHELREILEGVAAKGRVVGLDLTEVNPYLDLHGMTSQVAVTVILEFLGAIFEHAR